ncbi:MFS general substrate transporter [Lichtheimia hyalospora FSU 10163]|nr:MFS general substrate transporter [Lichtheimia hyalospora FSU 10163]
MASSMQHSVFEAWYVAEHHTQHLPSEWVARTFATGAFLNGIVAILAGMVANAVVDTWGLWTPFALAILFLAIAGCMVMTTWEENYGKSKNGSIQLVDTLLDGLHVLWNNSNILILGAAQTVFECAMYIFVLLYTPAIENVHILLEQDPQHSHDVHDLPLGYLFSTMMFAIMVGSLTFQKFEGWPMFVNNKERLLIPALGCASISFAVMAYDHVTSLPILLVAYHIFEFTTGLFHPTLSSLKAEVIPEETRAVVMTMLRIPMNIGVGIAMWHADMIPIDYHFAICALITLFGCILVAACYQPSSKRTTMYE